MDAVVISAKGIDFYEIKNRGGRFVGAPGAKTWTQYIGSQVHEINNPIIQNEKHIEAFENYCLEMEKSVFDLDSALFFHDVYYKNIILFLADDYSLEIDGIPDYYGNFVYYYGRKEFLKKAIDMSKDFVGYSEIIKNNFEYRKSILRKLRKYKRNELNYILTRRYWYYQEGLEGIKKRFG